jgi:hypothetical protein
MDLERLTLTDKFTVFTAIRNEFVRSILIEDIPELGLFVAKTFRGVPPPSSRGGGPRSAVGGMVEEEEEEED